MSYTLTFRFYLDPNNFLLSGLPLIIRIIFIIILNYYILRASKNQPEGVKKSKYLEWCAIINFIFTLVPLFLPELIIIVPPTLSPQDLSFISFFYILTGLIVSVPFLISYGVLIFLFARQNRDILGSYLFAAGICFIVGYSLYILNLGGNLLSILSIWDLLSVMSAIPITFFGLGTSSIAMIGFVLFLIHGVIKKDIYFKTAGILFFVTFGFNLVYSLFILLFATF